MVPGAAEALRIARLGYAAGRFPYSDLLMAQRGYAEARRARLSAARDAELASAERDRAAIQVHDIGLHLKKNEAGEITMAMRERLRGIQTGEVEDTHGWNTVLVQG